MIMKRRFIACAVAGCLGCLSATTGADENYVLSLDGDGDYVHLPSNILNDLDEVTVECWAKWRRFGPQPQPFGFGRPWQGLMVTSGVGNNDLAFFIYSSKKELSFIKAIQALQLDRWYHIAAVTGAGKIKLYLDGELVGEDDFTGSLSAATRDGPKNYLGRSQWIQNADLAGELDEVRIWSKARGQKETLTDMHKRLTGDEPGLVALWNFDAGDARDASSNGFDGVMMGDARCVPGQPFVPSAKATVTGVIRDRDGTALQNASVSLRKDDRVIAETLSDAAGRYEISVWPSEGYRLFAMHGRVSAWELQVELQAGQSQTISLSLHPGISGKVMTKTNTPLPHVIVQALQTDSQQAANETTVEPTVAATTRTDGRGEYHITGLKPGSYLLRCHILDRYVYYRQSEDSNEVIALAHGDALQVGPDQTHEGVDFPIAPFRKGTWHTYTERDAQAEIWWPNPYGVA